MRRIALIFLLVSITSSIFSGITDTVFIYSKSMQKKIPNLVVVPEGYKQSMVNYPVLYLLHGATNDFTEWTRYVPDLGDVADQYQMIIICPDGGRTSWYFDSPIDSSFRYETYVARELIDFIDSKYRTLKDRKKRAIAGLSMGGHGAFYLAFRHQDKFGAAGSMAGGLDIRPFPQNWDISKRLGVYSAYPEFWEKNTVINLIHLLNGNQLSLIFDCGINDIFIDANRRMHKLLLERNILHTYIERPGGHDLPYWKETIKYQLLYFHNFFNGE